MTMSTHLLIAHALASVILAQAHAATPIVAAAGSGGAPTDIFQAADKIKTFFDTLFTHFLPIGLSACAVWYAWGGLQWITAGGAALQVASAKKTWWHATIGLVGVILATPFVNTIHNMFG